jgi:hypothetical protein
MHISAGFLRKFTGKIGGGGGSYKSTDLSTPTDHPSQKNSAKRSPTLLLGIENHVDMTITPIRGVIKE